MKASKEDKAILELTTHMCFMSYMALYDVFGFKEKRIRRYYETMTKLKQDWSNNIVTTESMLKYCEAKKIDAYGFMKRIPTSKKIALVGKNVTPSILKYIESGLLINVLMSVIVLKEEFRFTKAQLQTFLDKVDYYIDSYTRKQPKTNIYYLNDNMILGIFRDELKIDLNTGRKVA